jgi:hypothetical protein
MILSLFGFRRRRHPRVPENNDKEETKGNEMER